MSSTFRTYNPPRYFALTFSPDPEWLKSPDPNNTDEGKELYSKRKETIERVFGTAKEHHAMRYTQQVGKEKMAMKVGLTFACMNMKKLANILSKRPKNGPDGGLFNDLLNACFSLFSKVQFSYA